MTGEDTAAGGGRDTRSGRAIVLGDGDAPHRNALDRAWPGWDRDTRLVVAADGGARVAAALGLRIDRWVGDADSYPRADVEKLATAGVAVRLVPTAKDESDLELAVVEAAEAGVAAISVLGALGGTRFDHALANVGLLAHPALAAVEVRLLDDTTRVTLLAAPDRAGDPVTATFDGRTGDLVSLLPLSAAAEGIDTAGLEFPLRNEPLAIGPARGLSNVRTGPSARVTLQNGRLLVIETPVTVDP